MKEYLDTQSMVDCTTFMDESFDSLSKFSDAFNVSPFVPVIVGTAITHHLMLTSLWVNVSHFPLKIFLLPLTSDAMAASGQMALLSYVARQSITVQEGQAQLKPILRTGTAPNPQVQPWIECGPKPAEAEVGPDGANTVKERSIGGPVIQDS